MSLRLDFDDAVEIADDGVSALSWSVCEQPWVDGDIADAFGSARAERISQARLTTKSAPSTYGPRTATVLKVKVYSHAGVTMLTTLEHRIEYRSAPLRIEAVSANFFGFPAANSRW